MSSFLTLELLLWFYLVTVSVENNIKGSTSNSNVWMSTPTNNFWTPTGCSTIQLNSATIYTEISLDYMSG